MNTTTKRQTERLKYQLVSIGSMNMQINLRLPEKLLTSATAYAEKNGYGTVQDLIRESLRERLFDEPTMTKKEIELALRLAEVSKRKGLYGTEQQLFRALKKQQKVRA